MFARMTHGIPEYNALTDKHCQGHNFLTLAPVKQLRAAGLLKKEKGKVQIVDPPRYLFYGAQPDGEVSTRPATGSRTVKFRKFQDSRKPKLSKVEKDRRKAIKRSRFEPMDRTKGVNSALRVVLSSPDLLKKREEKLRKRRANSPMNRSGGHSPMVARRDIHTAPSSNSGGSKVRKGRKSGTSRAKRASWSNDAGERPLHADSNGRLEAINQEYKEKHSLPPEYVEEFLAEKRRKEEEEEARAAELDARSRKATGYYSQFSSTIATSGTASGEQVKMATGWLHRAAERSAQVKEQVGDHQRRWEEVEASAEASNERISEHFAALRAVLDEREAAMKAQLGGWVEKARKQFNNSMSTLQHAHAKVKEAAAKCEEATQFEGKELARDYMKRAGKAADVMNAAVIKAQDAGDRRMNGMPDVAKVEAFFDLEAARELENRLTAHGQVLIVPISSGPKKGRYGSGAEVRPIAL